MTESQLIFLGKALATIGGGLAGGLIGCVLWHWLHESAGL
jgi:hypothetical protein